MPVKKIALNPIKVLLKTNKKLYENLKKSFLKHLLATNKTFLVLWGWQLILINAFNLDTLTQYVNKGNVYFYCLKFQTNYFRVLLHVIIIINFYYNMNTIVQNISFCFVMSYFIYLFTFTISKIMLKIEEKSIKKLKPIILTIK